MFVAHGLRRENKRLQPWRYIYELALRFAARQHVVIITNCDGDESDEEWVPNLKVVHSQLLSPKQRYALINLINGYQPERIWWSTTPRSLVYLAVWKRLHCPIIALVTCPLYPWGTLLRAWLHGVPWEELEALVMQRLMPRWLFARMLSSSVVVAVITQSEKNRKVLVGAGVPERKIMRVPVGLDPDERRHVSKQQLDEARVILGFPDDAKVFLYLGAVRRIRGTYALFDAFAIAAQRQRNIYLGVLARGADHNLLVEVHAYCHRLGIGDRVKVVGGWLDREQVWACIEACDVVTLPFVVVPSDVPLAILEALARGKPVIASAIDGIPELLEERGILIDPLNGQEFAEAIIKLATSESSRRQMSHASRKFMDSYPTWDEVVEFIPSIKH